MRSEDGYIAPEDRYSPECEGGRFSDRRPNGVLRRLCVPKVWPPGRCV